METTEKKLKGSVRRRKEKEERKKASLASGESKARYGNVPSSPRKMRLVADLVRGKSAAEAMGILKFSSKLAAKPILKILTSAIANWSQKYPDHDLEEAGLYIKEIRIDEGSTLKRMRPAPQGRGYRVRKRSNHINLVIGSTHFNEHHHHAEVEAEETTTDNNQ